MKRSILLAICMFIIALLYGQSVREFQQRTLTLKEAITVARRQSVEAEMARNQLRSAYWAYRSYRAELLPEITLKSQLPSYQKKYTSYQHQDGSYTFVPSNNLGLSGSFQVVQQLWATGGQLELTSSLDYLKQIKGNEQYMSVPLSFTLRQPLFSVNEMRWKRRIEPTKYKEAKARFLTATEEVTMKCIRHFFDLLLAQDQLKSAEQNLENATRLYRVAQAKRKMGSISKNDVRQLHLSLLQSQRIVTSRRSDVRSNMFTLRSFLGLEDEISLQPLLPKDELQAEVNYADALRRAEENHATMHTLRRRQLEADYKLAKAKGNLRNIDLVASLGYSGQDRKFSSTYHQLRNNQVVQVGITIPLLDWGKRRGAVKSARSYQKLVRSQLRKERIDFNQSLFVLVEHCVTQYRQLQLAKEANQIAQQRYDTMVKAYMTGQLGTLELMDAQSSKDRARQQMIQELFYYWYYFYQLRSITLWNYQKNSSIDADIQAIISEK